MSEYKDQSIQTVNTVFIEQQAPMFDKDFLEWLIKNIISKFAKVTSSTG